MSNEKEKDGLSATEEEKTALKVGENHTDGHVDMLDDSAFDNSRARFISTGSEKGDGMPEVYVDVEGKTKLDEHEFVGLTKEELMKYADDPKWVKIRKAFLAIFWIGWFGMLAAAIIIIVLAPKCPPRPKLEWWQTSTVYEVFPKSFKDSDKDGTGDLNGVHEKLDYLTGQPDSINISAVLLTSIFPHGNSVTANGYDITDFVDVSPEYGTLDDFYSMRVAMHKKGLKVILDFVPNHSGKDHEWFKKSQNREGTFTDYYVWRDGPSGQSGEPNDWTTPDGKPAWNFDPKRGQYYLAQYGPDMPDFNLYNKHVRQELQDILVFWMEQGVDGFRVKGADYLFECANYTNQASCQKFQPESYEIVTDWREIIDEFGKNEEKTKYLMVESQGTVNQTVQYYEFRGIAGAHAPINRQLLTMETGCDAQCTYDKITSWISISAATNRWNNWQIGNPSISRVSSRFNKDPTMVNLLNMLMLTLPGTGMTYYGEEIGMHDLEDNQVTGDNKYRSPMQWAPDTMAGFTEGNSTWEPIASDANLHNVKSQMAHGAGLSNIEIYSQLVKLRQEPSFQWGNLDVGVAGNILFYIRQATGFPGFLVAMNMGTGQTTVDFVHNAPNGIKIPNLASVVSNTGNFVGSHGEFDVGAAVDLSNLLLREKQGVIFKWEEDPNK